MSFSNVRRFLNRQMGATTGRAMQSDRTLGFNPMAAPATTNPATTNPLAQPITPSSPVERMMFASEPVGPPSDPSIVGTTDPAEQAANAALLGFTDSPLSSAFNLISYSNPATAIAGKLGKAGLQGLNNALGDPYGKVKGKISEAYDFVKGIFSGTPQSDSVDFGPIAGTSLDPSVASAVLGMDVDAVTGASPSMGFDGGMAGIGVGGDLGAMGGSPGPGII